MACDNAEEMGMIFFFFLKCLVVPLLFISVLQSVVKNGVTNLYCDNIWQLFCVIIPIHKHLAAFGFFISNTQTFGSFIKQDKIHAYLSVSAVVFSKQFLAHTVHICVNYMHIYVWTSLHH